MHSFHRLYSLRSVMRLYENTFPQIVNNEWVYSTHLFILDSNYKLHKLSSLWNTINCITTSSLSKISR